MKHEFKVKTKEEVENSRSKAYSYINIPQKEMKNIEKIESGICCDNTECTYEDKTVESDDYINWVNKPCPECGENLLTEEDYLTSLNLDILVNLVNSMTTEELDTMSRDLGNIGFDKDDILQTTVKIHKGIHIKDVKVISGKD